MIIPIRILIFCKDKLDTKPLVDILLTDRYNPYIQNVDKEKDLLFLLENYQWDILFIDYNSLDYIKSSNLDAEINWIDQTQKKYPAISLLLVFDEMNRESMKNFTSKFKIKCLMRNNLISILPLLKIWTKLEYQIHPNMRLHGSPHYTHIGCNEDIYSLSY